MKGGKPHRVPLTGRTLEILAEMRPLACSDDDYIFPGPRPGKPLSNMAMAQLLNRMGVEGTVDGFPVRLSRLVR